MARSVRDEVILIIYLRFVFIQRLIIAEGSTGETIIQISRQALGNTAAKAYLHPITVGLASIGDHAPASPFGKCRQLDILNIHIKECQFGMQTVLDQFTADTHFIIPAVLRFIGSHLFHLCRLLCLVGHELRHQIVPGIFLHQVTKHLHIVASRLISFGNRHIRKRTRRTLIPHRHLWQHLQKVLRCFTFQSCLDRQNTHRTSSHRYTYLHTIYRRVVIQLCLFIIQPDTCRYRQSVRK